MPFTRERFAARYPVLYHISLATSLAQIEKHGLLSTSRLLDFFEVEGARRASLESSPRGPLPATLEHVRHGKATLNDQSPLLAASLAKCLDGGLSVAEWCQTLNERVFFWPTLELCGRLDRARRGVSYDRILIEADTASLLDLCGDRVELSSINSGNTRRRPARRGANTFQTIASFQGGLAQVKEVTVRYAVKSPGLFRLSATQPRRLLSSHPQVQSNS